MRKRFTLLWTLVVLGAALALPATTAAGSPYSYVVLDNYCDGGQPNIIVRMKKPAGYFPDKFQIVAQGQHKNLGGGSWRNEGSSRTFSKDIPNQYAKFTWTKGIVFDPPDGQWHRIKLRLKVIDGGSTVAASTIYSVKC